MSLLRALRAYVGLGPDDDYENRYLDSYGDRVDIDLTGRSRRTTHEFAQSGAVATSRPGTGGRHGQSRVDQRSVTNRTKNPPGLRSPIGDEDQAVVVESDTASVARSQSNPADPGSVSPLTSSTTEESDPHGSNESRKTRSEAGDFGEHEPDSNQQGAVVRSIDSARTRPKTVAPESFADAKTIGDDFKFGTPIVLNLQGLDRELARRLIDFASGVCYALDGSMEKLAAQVFLLTPDGVEVSESDRLRIEQRGYAR